MALATKTQTRPTATHEAIGLPTNTQMRDVAPSPDHPVLCLQKTVGNQAALDLLQSGLIQPKLRIGPPDDAYEREADRVADAVMRMTEPASAETDAGPAPMATAAAPCYRNVIGKYNGVSHNTESDRIATFLKSGRPTCWHICGDGSIWYPA